MKKLMIIITKLTALDVPDIGIENFLKNNKLGNDNEWYKEFINRVQNSELINHITPIPANTNNQGKICEFIKLEGERELVYLVHGCSDYWLVGDNLQQNTENVLNEILKIINLSDKEKNESIKLGFVCHTGQEREDKFRDIVEKVFEKEDVEFWSRVSSFGDEYQYERYKNIFTEDGKLNIRYFKELWQYNSIRYNLTKFHLFLTLKAVHLETVRVLLERKRIQEAKQAYENEFGNDSLMTFIEDKVKKNSEYIRYCTIVVGEKNQVREHVEKLNPESYSQLGKNNLEVKPLEDFIQWFNKFSECVAEELA